MWFHDNTSYRNSSYNYNLVNRQGPSKDEAVDVNGYGHRVERNLSMVSDGKENHVTMLRDDEGNNHIVGNSFSWVNKNSGGWSYTAYGNSIFENTKVANLSLARDADGMLTEETLAVFKQKSYLGLGCSFEGYQEEIARARSRVGAEIGMTPTAINSAKYIPNTAPGATYDLQGRQVAQPGKGLYVRNGKKLIIR